MRLRNRPVTRRQDVEAGSPRRRSARKDIPVGGGRRPFVLCRRAVLPPAEELGAACRHERGRERREARPLLQRWGDHRGRGARRRGRRGGRGSGGGRRARSGLRRGSAVSAMGVAGGGGGGGGAECHGPSRPPSIFIL